MLVWENLDYLLVCNSACVCVTSKTLAHTIMEAEKSQHQQLSWRLRRTNGVIHSQSKGLRHRRANGLNSSLSPSQKTNVPPQKLSGRKNSFIFRGQSAFLFYSGLQLFGDLSALERAICFANWYVDLIQKHQEKCSTHYLGTPRTGQVDT